MIYSVAERMFQITHPDMIPKRKPAITPQNEPIVRPPVATWQRPILGSVLLHLVIGWLCWQQELPNLAPPAPAIATFLYQPAKTPPASKTEQPLSGLPVALTTNQITTNQLTTKPETIATSAAAKHRTTTMQPITQSQLNTTRPAVSKPQAGSAIVVKTATPPRDNRTLAERSLAAVAARQRQLQLQPDNSVLQHIRQKPEIREPAAAKPHRLTTPVHVAADVVAVTADGSFIEKIGDGCVLAQNGADLRQDIFSVKVIPCGQDNNKAMFERIMGNIGQHNNNPTPGGGKSK